MSVAVTLGTTTYTTQAGLVLCLDSASNPLNFLIAYYNLKDGKLYIDKCVNGTYTNITSATLTYVAGATVRVRRTGIYVDVSYNDVGVFSYTLVDAALISATIGGLFSTDSVASFDNFSATSTLDMTYLLYDQFTTAKVAPLGNRLCEPGPGVLVPVDTTNRLSISSGVLQSSSGSAVFSVRGVLGYAKTGGRCLAVNVTRTNVNGWLNIGWDNNTAGSFQGGHAFRTSGSGVLGVYAGSSSWTSPITTTTGVNYAFYVIQRPTAGAFFVKDGVLLFVSTDNVATLYAGVGDEANVGVDTFDNLRVIDLGAPWNTDTGIATSYSASANANDTGTMEADATVEATRAFVTDDIYELSVRRTDDNNRWIIRCSQAGSTIKLIVVQGGVETEVASAAQTFTNGTSYRVWAICNGSSIRTYVNFTACNNYASATFNQSATGTKVNLASTIFAAWPYTLSGAALAALQAI
jgi:hypothetical protein